MTNTRRSFTRIRARLSSDERGFTMIEIIMAILIFSVMISGIATMQGSTLNLIRNDRNRSIAANLAADEMDTVRSTTFTNLAVGQVTTVRTVDGVPYTVIRDSAWVPAGASVGACDAPAGSDPAYLRVTVSVTWNRMSGIPPVTSSTVVTPPVGAYDPSKGHLAVRVADRNGDPASGIQVSITGPQSASQFTTAEGCVFFGFLSAGSYTATLTKAGYVNDQGLPSPAQTASVSAGVITSMIFQYDAAATLVLTLAGKDTGAAAPSTVPLTLGNTHFPLGTKLVTGSGSPRTISNLFPFTDGYDVWAGSCADADPGASGPDAVAVEPATTTAATVLMPEVRVVVTHLGAPWAGQTVQAIHASATGCTGGLTYTVGTTDAAGQITFALPYGTWSIKVNATTIGTTTLLATDPPGPREMAVTL